MASVEDRESSACDDWKKMVWMEKVVYIYNKDTIRHILKLHASWGQAKLCHTSLLCFATLLALLIIVFTNDISKPLIWWLRKRSPQHKGFISVCLCPLHNLKNAKRITINYCCGRSACHLHSLQKWVGNLCQNWPYRLKSYRIMNLVSGRFWIQLLWFTSFPLAQWDRMLPNDASLPSPHHLAHSLSACFPISLLCVTVIFYFT